MTPSVLLFRAFIVASVATGVLGGALDLLLPGLLPDGIEVVREVPRAEIEAAVSVQLLSFLGFVIQMTAAVGLFLFKPWARGFALAITAANLLFYPLYGVQARSNWSHLLLDVSTMLWGAVLATGYVSSLAGRFTFDYYERSDD